MELSLIITTSVSLPFFMISAECSVGTKYWEKRKEIHSQECHNLHPLLDIVGLIK